MFKIIVRTFGGTVHCINFYLNFLADFFSKGIDKTNLLYYNDSSIAQDLNVKGGSEIATDFETHYIPGCYLAGKSVGPAKNQ